MVLKEHFTELEIVRSIPAEEWSAHKSIFRAREEQVIRRRFNGVKERLVTYLDRFYQDQGGKVDFNQAWLVRTAAQDEEGQEIEGSEALGFLVYLIQPKAAWVLLSSDIKPKVIELDREPLYLDVEFSHRPVLLVNLPVVDEEAKEVGRQEVILAKTQDLEENPLYRLETLSGHTSLEGRKGAFAVEFYSFLPLAYTRRVRQLLTKEEARTEDSEELRRLQKLVESYNKRMADTDLGLRLEKAYQALLKLGA